METVNVVILSICLALIIIVGIFLFIVSSNKKTKIENNNILFFFNIDLNKWRFKANYLDWNKNLNTEKFKYFTNQFFDTGWSSLTKLFQILGEEENKWKKSINYCVQNQTSTSFKTKISFKIKNTSKPLIYSFDVNLTYMDDSYISAKLFYNGKNKKNKKLDQHKTLSKEDLFKFDKPYILFLSFSLINIREKNSNKSHLDFINKITSIIKYKNISFFKSNDFIIFVFNESNYSTINKLKNKITKTLNKNKEKWFLKNLYDGVSFVECSNKIQTENDLAKVMTRISFSLLKSKISKEIFLFSEKNIQFNEFEEFKSKLNSLNKSIKNISDVSVYQVKSIKSKREVFEYLKPNISIEDDYWNKYIIEINEFDKKIRDRFVEYVIKNYKLGNKKIMIDINDYQLEKMFDKIKEIKNVIFIINIVKYTNTKELIRLLNLLNLSEIKFALNIEDFDSNTFSILSTARPKMIVISNDFIKKLSNDKSNLLLMNAMIITEHLGITLVFNKVEEEIKNDIVILSKAEKLYIEDK